MALETQDSAAAGWTTFNDDQDNAASGWTTFNDDQENRHADDTAELSPSALLLRRLEEAPDSIVAELLDDGEDLIQEFRSGNACVVQRLCMPESLRILVQHIIWEPEEGVSPERARRRSHTAAELLVTCQSNGRSGLGGDDDDSVGARLADAFFAPLSIPAAGDSSASSSGSAWDLLWTLLLADEGSSGSAAWHVLAGYFCSTVSALWSRRRAEVAACLRARGPPQVLKSFLRLLDVRCIAELLVSLLCVEVPEQLVFPMDGLLQELLEGTEAVDNLAFVINSFLAQACHGRLFDGALVVQQISSPEVLVALMDQVLLLHPAASSTVAASILSNFVSRTHLLEPHPLLLGPGPDLLGVGAMDDSWEEEEANEGQECGDAQRRSVPQEQLLAVGSALVEQIQARLPQLCDVALRGRSDEERNVRSQTESARSEELLSAILLLLNVQQGDAQSEEGGLGQLLELASHSKHLQDILESQGLTSPRQSLADGSFSKASLLGALRRARCHANARTLGALSCQATVEVVALLTQLARTQSVGVFEAFREASVLERALALLLSSSSSVLHNTVWALMCEIARSPAEVGKQAMLDFLRDGKSMGRAIEAMRCGSTSLEAQPAHGESVGDISECQSQYVGTESVGCLGQLLGICTELRDLGRRRSEVQAALAQLDGWTEVVLPELRAFEAIQAEPLGGFLEEPEPEGHPSQTAAEAEAENVDVDELRLEDLRDINEDLDTELLLHLASKQQVHRQSQEDRRAMVQRGGALQEDQLGTEVPGDDLEQSPELGQAPAAPSSSEQQASSRRPRPIGGSPLAAEVARLDDWV